MLRGREIDKVREVGRGRERERQTEREKDKCIYIYVYIYIEKGSEGSREIGTVRV